MRYSLKLFLNPRPMTQKFVRTEVKSCRIKIIPQREFQLREKKLFSVQCTTDGCHDSVAQGKTHIPAFSSKSWEDEGGVARKAVCALQ